MPTETVAGAALGALLVMGALLGIVTVFDRLFVTRREFDVWRQGLGAELEAIRKALERIEVRR